ncbi:hypothetical protein Q5M85_04765 [Paraclostridium bifermentans]|nr:hypothetical protein [Paraclostridium bifermentans]
MYAVFASILASIIATQSIYKFTKLSNEISKELSGSEKAMNFTLPIFESVEFLIVSIIMCLIAVFLCKRRLKK